MQRFFLKKQHWEDKTRTTTTTTTTTTTLLNSKTAMLAVKKVPHSTVQYFKTKELPVVLVGTQCIVKLNVIYMSYTYCTVPYF